MAKKIIDEQMIEEKIDEKIEDAQKYVHETQDKLETMVTGHPIPFVVGAFLGGLFIGKMMSSRS